MDAEQIERALNELCTLRLAEVEVAKEAADGDKSEERGCEEAPEGANLLDRIVRYLQRYVVLSVEQADVLALWVQHTHAFEACDTTPYLEVTSAEKRSGKTRLLEVLNTVTAR